MSIVGNIIGELRAYASGGATKASSGASPQQVEAPWQTLVLVCSKCKGARRGPDARDIRKGLKQRIGKDKRLRIVESECLSLCPDDAITVCIVKTNEPANVRIVQTCDELDGLAALVNPA